MNSKHLFRFIFMISVWVLLFENISHSQDNIISFYPKAYAKTQNPPEEKKLIIIAEQKIDDKFVSFLGVEKRKVLLAVVTRNKLENPKKAFYLKPKEERFGSSMMWDLVHRYAIDTFAQELFDTLLNFSDSLSENLVDSLKKQDSVKWGYLFDRNCDGQIDYVAFLVGPLHVKQKDFPQDFPKGGIVDQLQNYGKLTAEQIQIFKKSWVFVFTHISDENFDGRADGAIFEVMDPERFWVDRWMVLFSSNFNGVIDTCWQFQDSIQIKERNCLKLSKGYWTKRAGAKKGEFGNQDLAKLSEMLSLLDKAVNLCGLTKDSFYKE